jgi:quinol monooxygenase YgiN
MSRQGPERGGTDVATVRADAGVVTYVQVWSVADAAGQQQWLRIMRENIHILRAKPGFVTMTLHSSIDGTSLAVYAQWSSRGALAASLRDPEAAAAHDRMAQVGEPNGSLYVVEDVYGPSAL